MNSLGSFWRLLAILAVVLGFCFSQSFSPTKVLFANDGPLGANAAQADYALAHYFGYWQDLNWLGYQMPGFMPTLDFTILALFGPVAFAKFIAPISLLLLGLSAWLFYRQAGLHPAACILAGLAMALNMNPFSNSCWGLSSWTLMRMSAFLALAAIVSSRGRWPWLKLILAGCATGWAVINGFDIGAIFSLFIAGFVVFVNFAEPGPLPRKVVRSVVQVALVAFFAACVAAQALNVLIGTQIKGISGTDQDLQTKAQRWDPATQWSLPKIETLRVLIPGLYGYRMDAENGGNYWGRVGQQPGWETHHQGLARHSGSGEYAGVFVVLIALFGVVQSFRKQKPLYSDLEKKWIWFWAAMALVALLMAFGRHAPFYQVFYALPFMSTIRNPIKFMMPFQMAVNVLFAFGLHGLWMRYIDAAPAALSDLKAHWKRWWSAASSFDKRWVTFLVLLGGASLLGAMIYHSSTPRLTSHLSQNGFAPEQAQAIARFSQGEVWQYVLFYLLSAGTALLLLSGFLAGRRRLWALLLPALLMAVDLGRANVHWIVYFDYSEKYASNSVLDLLRNRSYEQRVTGEVAPMTRAHFVNNQAPFFAGIYNEWLQHHFQFYNILSLDIVQMPRMPKLDESFIGAFRPSSTNYTKVSRVWELTNTRFVLGMSGFLDFLNQQFDPQGRRFRIHTQFDFAAKPGITQPKGLEDLTTQIRSNGQFAIFEFTGALPKAKLFAQWQVEPDDEKILGQLQKPEFNPAELALLHQEPGAKPAGTNAAPGKVEISSYSPKRVELKTDCAAPSVLLLNSRYDPAWKVFVDDAETPMLRCNYLFQGALIPAGAHKVEFKFRPDAKAFYVSLSGVLLALFICGFLAVAGRTNRTPLPLGEKDGPTEVK